MTDQPRKRITIDAPDGPTILAARHLDPTEGRVQIGSTVDTSTRSAITRVLGYIAKAHGSASVPASTAPLAAGLPQVQGRCPACGRTSLFLGDGGYVTCSIIDCPNPSAADQMLHGELQIPRPAATEATEAERCCVCGSAAVVYHNHREQPFCWPCADCPCGQDACIRTGLHRTTAEKQADAQAQIEELERNNRALVKCAERAGVRRDQLATTLREVLDAFAGVTSPTSGGVMGYQAPPIHPDDMDRWRAVLNPPKEQSSV